MKIVFAGAGSGERGAGVVIEGKWEVGKKSIN
jgi:hypothetical protein